MLGRRILRIKAFKTIYAYAVTGQMTQAQAAKQLESSCEATRDLYLYMLSIIPCLTAEASARLEAAKGKLNPTEEDLNPNDKFAANALSAALENDPDFNKLLERKKLSWSPYDIFIRDVFTSISGKDYYKKYMAEPSRRSMAEDCKLFTRIFEEEFVDNESLEHILEDISILWIDDLAYALTWCCRTLDDFSAGKPWRLPALYQSDIVLKKRPDAKVGSDKDFVGKLVRCALAGYEKYFERVAAMAPEWDKDRLFSSDMAVIACAMAEIENFDDIPAKVSINEYVEISKFYCSPKSRSFINGVLDRMIKENNII